MRLALALLLLVSCAVSAETSIRYGGVSTHFSSNKEFNSFHRAFIVEHNSYVAGYFYNSFFDDTFIVGKQFKIRSGKGGDILITPAVTYGYRESGGCYKYQERDDYSARRYCPAILVEARTNLSLKPGILTGGSFIAITLGYDL